MSTPSSSSVKRKTLPSWPSKRSRMGSLTTGAVERESKIERTHKNDIAKIKRAYQQEIQALKDEHKQALQKLHCSPEAKLRVELIDERRTTLDWQVKNCELARQLKDANAELTVLRNETFKLRKEASDSNSCASKISKLEMNLAHANIIKESILSSQKTKYRKQIEALGADLDQAREEAASAKHEKRIHRKNFDNQVAALKARMEEKMEGEIAEYKDAKQALNVVKDEKKYLEAEVENRNKYIRYLKRAHIINSPHIDIPRLPGGKTLEGTDLPEEKEHHDNMKRKRQARSS